MQRPFDSKRLIILISLWTLSVSILRSIRMPNDFAEAHWLLDYRHGFIKRGLIGSIYSLLAKILKFDMSPETIAVFSSLVFAGFTAALIFILFRIIKLHNYNSGIVLMSLVFVSSPYIIMNSHIFGYLDPIITTCAVISIAFILSNRFFPAAVISSCAMLVHENYLLIGMPLVLFASVLKYRQSDSRLAKVFNVAAFIFPLLVFFFIVIFQMYNSDNIRLRKELISYLGSFDFIATRGRLVAIWQTVDFMDFFNDQKAHFFNRLFDDRILVTFMPTLFVIIFSIHSKYRISPFNLISLFLISIISVPLLMHLFAFDSTRISIYTIGAALIIHWILSETRDVINSQNDLLVLAALPVLTANVFFHTKLMDGCIERFSTVERGLLYAPTLILAVLLLIKSKTGTENS